MTALVAIHLGHVTLLGPEPELLGRRPHGRVALELAARGRTRSIIAIAPDGLGTPAERIRATLSAVPRRLPVLWAKAGVFTAVAAGVARTVVGAGLYLTVVGLLGVGLGFIIRNTAGAIATLFGLLLVLPTLGEVLPSSWGRHLVGYLPSNAGQAVMSVHRAPGDLAPWTGFAVFCGYAAASIVAAAILLKRRDA